MYELHELKIVKDWDLNFLGCFWKRLGRSLRVLSSGWGYVSEPRSQHPAGDKHRVGNDGSLWYGLQLQHDVPAAVGGLATSGDWPLWPTDSVHGREAGSPGAHHEQPILTAQRQ